MIKALKAKFWLVLQKLNSAVTKLRSATFENSTKPFNCEILRQNKTKKEISSNCVMKFLEVGQ